MKTHVGGLVSIFIIIAMILYLHKRLHVTFTRGNTELSQAKYQSDIQAGGDHGKVSLQNDDIQFQVVGDFDNDDNPYF